MPSPRRRSKPRLDRIGALPDSLICHILSFLPTKLAVATSVLSKRWSPLWRSVLTLDFDDESFEDFNNFRHFVYSVIVSRNPRLPLQSFRIKCGQSNSFNAHDLNRFVQAAVERGLENFDLDVYHVALDDLKKLAPTVLSVLSCRTLVVLKLKYLKVYNVPLLVDFPSLKTLHLDSIEFSKFVHFMTILCGCPILEDFHMNDVILPNISLDYVREFKGFPKLVTANLCYFYENFPFAWLQNSKFVHAELMQISAYECPVPMFHNLTHIELVFHSHSWSGKWKLVIQVLHHCPELQNLTLVKGIDGILPRRDKSWTEPETIPECLSSRLRKCSLLGFGGIESELQFLEYILLNSKLLRTMTVKSNSCLDDSHKLQMLVNLASYPRGSVTCKLLFD